MPKNKVSANQKIKANLAKRFDNQFAEVVRMIHKARYNAIKGVNAELVKLYWSIGEYISNKIKSAEWGDAIVDGLADYIQTNHPEFKGFTRRSLYRMRQFYETYPQKKFVSTVLTQISWSSHLHILSKTKIHPDITGVLKDTYVLNFLNLPEIHSEKDLQKSIVANLRDFILEFGKDFTFAGQEYRIQAGKNDYFISAELTRFCRTGRHYGGVKIAQFEERRLARICAFGHYQSNSQLVNREGDYRIAAERTA